MKKNIAQRNFFIPQAALLTVAGIIYVNPSSALNFINYLVVWCAFIFIFNREDFIDFCHAFFINSAFISVFYVVQTTVYPETYGTTSPFGSWTDDSHFFSLMADTIPPTLETRDNYSLYSQSYSTIVRTLSVFSINHPMDAIFFQSGVAGLLSSFTKKLLLLRGADEKTAEVGFILTIVCPFLMMNGGVLLIRDTLIAAIFVYSICCIDTKRFPLAVASIAALIMLRPGTALILFPAYFLIYIRDPRKFSKQEFFSFALLIPFALGAGIYFGISFLDVTNFEDSASKVSYSGRELISELTDTPDGNKFFLAVQQLPFLFRFILNGVYMFMYPFFSPKAFLATPLFDLRMFLMSIVIPLQAFLLNAWFIAALISRNGVIRQQRQIALSVLLTLLLIGTYSLQTRHKTIIYPFYYAIVAVGLVRSKRSERTVGYAVSGMFLAVQVASVLR